MFSHVTRYIYKTVNLNARNTGGSARYNLFELLKSTISTVVLNLQAGKTRSAAGVDISEYLASRATSQAENGISMTIEGKFMRVNVVPVSPRGLLVGDIDPRESKSRATFFLD